jgi:predicted small metal-binding protein
MARMYIDCRQYPSDMNCSVSIAADSNKELIDAATQHAVAVHGHKDSPELREQISKMIKAQT